MTLNNKPDRLPIRIGISSCLVGQRVRFDANHKQDNYILGTLGEFFEFVPVCPEVAIGMGVPRPTIRLVGDAHAPRAVGVKDAALDVTDELIRYGRRQARELDDLTGYIFKSRSPSCGMERVKLYTDRGGVSSRGVGLYAREFMVAHPLLPCEEEGRLGDPMLRDNWLERVFAWRRWQELNRQRLTARALVEFHTRHKLALMAHGPKHYRELGQLVASAGKGPIRPLAETYIGKFMAALQVRATVRRHTNVLHHLMGYLKQHLDGDDKQELLELIDAYRLGRVPRIVPVTLLNHHFRRFPHEYVANQTYLRMCPEELKLRSYY